MNMTPEQAVQAFFGYAGQYEFLDGELAEAVRDIGDPDAGLPVTRTAETVADFLAGGWTHVPAFDAAGVTVLRRGKRTYAHIADCGDYRLVYIGD